MVAWTERQFMSGLPERPHARDLPHSPFKKFPQLSITLPTFLRNGWNYVHTSAFLLDSQAKFP